MSNWAGRDRILNGIRFHLVEQGEGSPVVLLHGFPGFWYCWRYQLPAVAGAGYRAVAPDLRGYNRSEKPPGVSAYHIDHLVADCATMLRTLGDEEGAFLVGHDWGGLIAWHTASRHPALVRKLVILNAPHPNLYQQLLHETWKQRIKSLYVALFQLPRLPELLLTIGGGAGVEWLMRNSGVNHAHFSKQEARRYREAITQPGAATAALNYYRSLARQTLSRGFRQPACPVEVPTLLLWGVRDVALVAANADQERLSHWVPALQVERLDASHWVQLDLPEIVNERMIAFLRQA